MVDLGLEQTFISYVKELDASVGRQNDGFFNPYQRVAYNRRWSAYLMRINQYADCEDLINENYYITAL